jgi:hypothetical protein
MRQAISKIFLRQAMVVAPRALVMGTATAAFVMYTKPDFTYLKSQIAQCAPLRYNTPSKADTDACRQELMSFMKARRNMCPLMVRLSWHDAGTYDAASNTGGPRAAMRFEKTGEASHDANAGLKIARDMLSPIKDKHVNLSNADFWSLTAICAI